MSYILDALKRSEGEKLAPQTLRAVEEQPVDEEYAEEATPAWQTAIRFALVALLAVAVGISIGWWQWTPEQGAQTEPRPSGISSENVSAAAGTKTADATVQPPAVTEAQPDADDSPAVTIIGQRPQPQRVAPAQPATADAWPPKGYSEGRAARVTSKPVAASTGERIVGVQPSLPVASEQAPLNQAADATSPDESTQPSPALQQRFAAVLAEMQAADEEQGTLGSESEPVREYTGPVVALSQMPQWYQDQVPSMDFDQHIYSSDPQQRWVSVSGEDVYEGQEVAPGVVLQRIEPQKVVLEYRQQQFTLPALGEW